MNRDLSASPDRLPGSRQRSSLDSRAFGVLLSAMFALILAVAATMSFEAQAVAVDVAGPVQHHAFA